MNPRFVKVYPDRVRYTLISQESWDFSHLLLKTIPMGTAYAVWTGIGAAGTAVFGMLVLGEPREVARIFCLVMIVAGTVGLKLFSGKVS